MSLKTVLRGIRAVFFIIFLSNMKNLIQIIMQKWGERIFSNRQFLMSVYVRIVIIMVLE